MRFILNFVNEKLLIFFNTFRIFIAQIWLTLLASLFLSSAFIFQCHYGWVRGTVDGFYFCSAFVLSSGGDRTVMRVSGVNWSNKTNSDVTFLYIYNQFIFYQFPKGIETFFPNITRIEFSDGSMITISSDDLKPFPRLSILTIKRHRLIFLDGDLFKYSPNLEILNLSSNKIQHIGQDIFKSLTNLKVVDVRNNSCCSYLAFNSTQIEKLKIDLLEECRWIHTEK